MAEILLLAAGITITCLLIGILIAIWPDLVIAYRDHHNERRRNKRNRMEREAVLKNRHPEEIAFFDRCWPAGTSSFFHSRATCLEQRRLAVLPFCVIHQPSNHHMRRWPMHIRNNTLIERLCTHGTGHPDPDSAAALNYLMYRDPQQTYGYGVHGCDGCCIRKDDLSERW